MMLSKYLQIKKNINPFYRKIRLSKGMNTRKGEECLVEDPLETKNLAKQFWKKDGDNQRSAHFISVVDKFNPFFYTPFQLKNSLAENPLVLFYRNKSVSTGWETYSNDYFTLAGRFTQMMADEIELNNEACKSLKSEMAKQLIKLSKCNLTYGRLVIFGVPLEKINNEKENYTYPSHPFGRLCECPSQCNDSSPQHRIIAQFFENDDNKIVINFDHHTEEQRKNYLSVVFETQEIIKKYISK